MTTLSVTEVYILWGKGDNDRQTFVEQHNLFFQCLAFVYTSCICPCACTEVGIILMVPSTSCYTMTRSSLQPKLLVSQPPSVRFAAPNHVFPRQNSQNSRLNDAYYYLDSWSQVSICSQRLIKKLQKKVNEVNQTIIGIAGTRDLHYAVEQL